MVKRYLSIILVLIFTISIFPPQSSVSGGSLSRTVEPGISTEQSSAADGSRSQSIEPAVSTGQSSAPGGSQLVKSGEAAALSLKEQTYLNLIDFDNAERMAREITEDIGIRLTASFRRDMTVDYLMNEFKNAGYDPYVHEFTIQNTTGTVLYYINGSIEIAGKKYICYGPVYSGNTAYQLTKAAITIKASTVIDWAYPGGDLTVSDTEDFAGKVVFVTNSGASAPSAAAYYRAALALQKAKAAAVIFEYYKPAEDGRTSYTRIGNTVSTGNIPITIPVGTVFYHEIHGALSSLKPGDTVRVTMDTSSRGRSVVAVLPSATGSDKTVYITSHMDTVLSTPGMNDNASGLVMTVELARALRNVPFEYNIAFICFDAEEAYLVGARRFCFDMSDEDRANFVADYNMDMIAGNQAESVHMFLNISDTRLQTLQRSLPSNKDRLIKLPSALAIAKGYEVFNYPYLAALKTGFNMNYFNICYDTNTDHLAFVEEIARNGNRFYNMRNAVNFNWRQNGRGVGTEVFYHRIGDSFDRNYNRERLVEISRILALAAAYSAKAYPSVTGGFDVETNKDTRTVTITGSGYKPGAWIQVIGAYDRTPVPGNKDFFDYIYADNSGNITISFESSKDKWLGGHTYNVSVNGVVKSVRLLATKATINEPAKISARASRPRQLSYEVDGTAYEFYSSNPSVAKVDNQGLVTPLRPGTVFISLQTTDGSNIAAMVMMTVTL